MKRWEYKTITIGINGCLDLNQIGEEGWEMCGVISHDFTVTYYFKKEL